jgi:hypothetical protein
MMGAKYSIDDEVYVICKNKDDKWYVRRNKGIVMEVHGQEFWDFAENAVNVEYTYRLTLDLNVYEEHNLHATLDRANRYCNIRNALKNHKVIATAMEGTCRLIEAEDGREYVILADNTVITRDEDNQHGASEALFPYNY